MATSSPAPTTAPILIIGAGAPGWALVDEIRRLDPRVPLALVSHDDGTQTRFAQPHDYLATAHAPGLALEYGHADPQELGVTLYDHTRVLCLDRHRHRVITTEGGIAYRAVVLATGRRARDDLLHAQPRSIQAATFSGARSLLEALDNGRLRHVAVAGHEGLACRVVELLSRAGVEVEWIFPADAPLAGQLPPPLPQRIRSALAHPNIVMHSGRRIRACNALGLPVRVDLDDGSHVDVDHMIWTDRVPGDTRLAMLAGLEATSEGIAVDTRGCTSDPDIYAIDACTATDRAFDLTSDRALRSEAAAIAAALSGHSPEPPRQAAFWHLALQSLPVAMRGHENAAEAWRVHQDTPRGTLLVQGSTERPRAMAGVGRCSTQVLEGRLRATVAPFPWPATDLV